jgi:uncharacterized protein YegP (UPF0339 family)
MIHFELYQDRKKEWRWRLLNSQNLKIIADSGEGYKRKGNAARAIQKMIEKLSQNSATGGTIIVEP